MRRRQFLNQFAAWGFQATACTTMGCGTLLHSERCGRPHSNDIDWRIVALDGLGLILFFVPGVIAFAVDFYTGAIYLPADGYSFRQHGAAGADDEAAGLKRVHVSRAELAPERIERVVSRHVGRTVSLAKPETRVSRLPGLDRFADQWRQHRTDGKFGSPATSLLDRLRRV